MSRLEDRFDYIEESLYDIRERLGELESIERVDTTPNKYLKERIKELESEVTFWQNKVDELVLKYEGKV